MKLGSSATSRRSSHPGARSSLLTTLLLLTSCESEGFGAPTDVAFLSDGAVVVTDGYENSRVAILDGGWVDHEWGQHGCGEGEFDVPHGVTIDAEDRIYVADRSNGRIQIFDREGQLLDVWQGPDYGRPWGLEVRDQRLYVVDGGDQDSEAPFGRVTVYDLEGTVLARFADGDEPVVDGHDLTVDASGAVYVGSLSGRVLRKFVPQ
jgi:DNA-binding beta-propeller fold protein YncE